MESSYPDLERICRLCLHQNLEPEFKLDIFSGAHGDSAAKELFIPVRIMTCTSLEVHSTDGLPKFICTECRYQLEKFYYFRKRSQMADLKLRKHTRLLYLCRKSRVFEKQEDEPYEEELEFGESLHFITAQDKLRGKKEQQKHQEWKEFIIKETEAKIASLTCIMDKKAEEEKEQTKQELRKQILEEMHTEREIVKSELYEEIEAEMRDKLREECLEQAKLELSEEMHRECRQQEREGLLQELDNYLKEKRNGNDAKSNGIAENCSLNQRAAQQNLQIDPLSITTRRTAKKRHAEMSLFKRAKQISVTFSDNDYDSNMKSSTEQLDKYKTKSSEAAVEEHEDETDCYDVKNEAESNDNARAEDGTVQPSELEIQEEDSYFGNEIETDDSQFQLTATENSSKETTSYQIAGIEQIQLIKKTTKKRSSRQRDMQGANDKNVMVFNIEQRMDTENLELVELVSLENNKHILIEENNEPENDVGKHPGFVKHILKDKTECTIEETVTDNNLCVLARSTDTPKSFKCSLCPMAFSTQHSLDRHMRMHKKMEQKGVTFQCEECKICLSCKSALTRHMLTHSGVRPHVCIHCDKSFVQREILKRHLQTHTGERPHKCHYCERTFTQKVNLAQHINKHHMAVPKVQQHSCHLCPKRFNHASGLSRHLATHAGVAFQCTECDRTFGDRSSIKRHIANVHGIRSIQFFSRDDDVADPEVDVDETQNSEPNSEDILPLV